MGDGLERPCEGERRWRMGVFRPQGAAVQRLCGGHMRRAFEEQKEAGCAWGVQRAELVSLSPDRDVM